jgi:hypothetical protein
MQSQRASSEVENEYLNIVFKKSVLDSSRGHIRSNCCLSTSMLQRRGVCNKKKYARNVPLGLTMSAYTSCLYSSGGNEWPIDVMVKLTRRQELAFVYHEERVLNPDSVSVQVTRTFNVLYFH